MHNSFLVGFAAWILPGAGHALKKEWVKAAIVAGVFWAMFVIAIQSGGSYYPGLTWDEGPLLVLLNVFARFGSVVGGAVSWVLSLNPPLHVAEWATYEYGGRFLEVAGLLNYLAVIDAAGSGEAIDK